MTDTQDEQPISEARANLTELVNTVRFMRRCIVLTRRDKPQAALVPVELAEVVHQAGGPDKAAELLRQALSAEPGGERRGRGAAPMR